MNAADLERVLGEIAHQILDHGVDSLGQWGCTSVTVELCPERARGVIDAGACRIGVCTSEPVNAHEAPSRRGPSVRMAQ